MPTQLKGDWNGTGFEVHEASHLEGAVLDGTGAVWDRHEMMRVWKYSNTAHIFEGWSLHVLIVYEAIVVFFIPNVQSTPLATSRVLGLSAVTRASLMASTRPGVLRIA